VSEAEAQPPARRRIAFFGLGQMGLPMAGHLLRAGHAVTGVDPAPEAGDGFAAIGGRTAPALDAVAGAEIVLTMLPDGKAVQRALLEGAPAVVDAMASGSIVLDMSSAFPGDTLELGRALEPRGIALVDAPVSGGVKKARDATLTIMTGGDPAAVERLRPILERMGSRIFRAGPLGSGHAMKALNNYVSAAGLAAVCEALLVGRKFGLEPETMVAILNASTGRNNSTEAKLAPFILNDAFNSGFALALMAKDLRTAHDLAAMLNVPTPLADCTETLWREASEALGPGADHTEIYRFLQSLMPDRPSGGR